jgi:hypothetical protein
MADMATWSAGDVSVVLDGIQPDSLRQDVAQAIANKQDTPALLSRVRDVLCASSFKGGRGMAVLLALAVLEEHQKACAALDEHQVWF